MRKRCFDEAQETLSADGHLPLPPSVHEVSPPACPDCKALTVKSSLLIKASEEQPRRMFAQQRVAWLQMALWLILDRWWSSRWSSTVLLVLPQQHYNMSTWTTYSEMLSFSQISLMFPVCFSPWCPEKVMKWKRRNLFLFFYSLKQRVFYLFFWMIKHKFVGRFCYSRARPAVSANCLQAP